ncbi:MAG: ABC transporter ATP-binding protein [Bacteroidales bacterium]
MNNFLKILGYIRPYSSKVILNVSFNLLSVIFSLFSLTMAIPFLQILFEDQPVVEQPQAFALSTEAIASQFNYYITIFIQDYGPSYALLFISLLIIITSFLRNAFKYLALYYLTPLRNGVVKDLRNNIYQKSMDLPLSYHSGERKGDIISRMSNDVHQVEISVISSLEMVFREPITIIVYLASLMIMSPQLTLFVLVLLPLSGLIIGRIGKTLKSTALRGQGKLGIIMSVVEETLSGIRIIKAFNAEEKMKNRFLSLNSFFTRIMNKMHRRQYLASPMSEFMGTFVVVIIMWYGGSMVLSGTSGLSSPAFITYLIIFSQIIHPSKSFSQAYYNIQRGMASAERIDEILQAPNPIREVANPARKHEFDSHITFKNVSFKYEKEWVLKDINLTIKKGQKVALVGPSGAGKSTFVDLIPRFYDATEGTILIDDIPITELSIADLRSLMGNVNQDPILFNESFFNNIAFGVTNVSEQRVIKAAEIANAREFIERYPLDYYTNVGERGGKLSGGQRQRISIARAVLLNPPILILDEATSSLDSESEKMVQQALYNIMQNRTAIVVAHRLSTIINADLICVMENGRIVEQGTHKELMEKGGMYKKLHDLQMFS